MNSIWQELAERITDNKFVVHLQPQLTTTVKSYQNIGMDALQVVYAPGPSSKLVGVFHVSPKVGPNKGNHSQLYVATTRIGDYDTWTVTNDGNPYSNAGSMGFIHIHSATGEAFLAYELETSQGNTIAIRRYANIDALVNDPGNFDEFQLTRRVHVAAEPNTWTDNTTDVKNVGTPSIESISGTDVNIRCHFSPDGTHDYPAKGIVSLGSSGGISQNWGHWGGFFANWVNDALRILGAEGKIGARDSIVWGGSHTYIFEAQLQQDAWSSWRPFLLVPGQNQAFKIDLNIEKTQTFANPHMVQLPENQLLQTYFVPSERKGNLAAGTLLRITQLPQTA